MPLYHHGRKWELDVLENPYGSQVRKQGHAVKLQRIREKARQVARGPKEVQIGEEPASRGMVMGAVLKALYHRGRLVGLDVRRDQDSLQVRKQGHVVRLWGNGEEIRQTLGRTKKGEGWEELVSRGMCRQVCVGWRGGPDNLCKLGGPRE